MADTAHHPSQVQGDPSETPPVRFWRKKEFIILAVFFFLVCVVLLSSRITGRPPASTRSPPASACPGT